MKSNVLISPSLVDELYFTGKTVVVIDVLRATTVIVTALMNQAREVIPVNSVEFGMKASGMMFGGKTVRGGERNLKKIDGFNLGNSPAEYDFNTVSGKSIVFLTTNGSRALVRTKFATKAFVCSFLNIIAVAKLLLELNEDFEILCSGSNGGFAMEDTVCAGKLLSEILNLGGEIDLNDSGKAAVLLAKHFGKNIKTMLQECNHGKLLIEHGFEEDITACSKVGITETIPVMVQNAVRVYTRSDAVFANPAQNIGADEQETKP